MTTVILVGSLFAFIILVTVVFTAIYDWIAERIHE